MKKRRITIIILFFVVLPIVGCIGGYWYGSHIDWLPLSSPPARPSEIVGIGVENSPEGELVLVIQTVNGDMYYYRHSAAPEEHWAEANEDRVHWLEEDSGPCGVTVRPFIPPPPGEVSECVEYVGYYAKQDPEVYVEQWVLLDGGTIWEWDYPDTIVRRNILFGFVGLLGGGLIGAIIFIGIRGSEE